MQTHEDRKRYLALVEKKRSKLAADRLREAVWKSMKVLA